MYLLLTDKVEAPNYNFEENWESLNLGLLCWNIVLESIKEKRSQIFALIHLIKLKNIK